MSFDARSLERLQQLGRTLPQPLPAPQPPPQPPPSGRPEAGPPGGGRRHKVETETDPEALFRELMQVSPDGSVPPHLLDRLREAEQDQARRRREQQQRELQQRLQSTPFSGGTSAGGNGQSRDRNHSSDASTRGSSPLRRQAPRPGEPPRPADSATQELYVAFQHLLLEDDSEG
ncbi:MAG: hypothetical protein ACKO0M_02025 [Cyanobium sp.]